MGKNVTIVSWDIAGAHPIGSPERFDYQPEDVNYFIGIPNGIEVLADHYLCWAKVTVSTG